MKNNKTYNVPALEKAIAILELLSEKKEELSSTEIYKELDLAKATAFIILNVLEQNGFVKKSNEGRYSLGVKLFNLGMAYFSKLDIIEVSRPFLKQLVNSVGFTTHLGTLENGKVLFVDKIEDNSFIKFSTYPGMISDFHISSLGKAIAAFLDDEELQSIVAKNGLGMYTKHTITTVDELNNNLTFVRQNGYAIEDEEGELGVRCIGAPIFSNTGKVIAAVSVTALRSDLLAEKIPFVGEKVKEIAAAISRQLGYVSKSVTV